MEKPKPILLINLDAEVTAQCRQLLQSAQLPFHHCRRDELDDACLYQNPWRLVLLAAGRQPTAELGAVLRPWPVIPTLVALSGCHPAADTAAITAAAATARRDLMMETRNFMVSPPLTALPPLPGAWSRYCSPPRLRRRQLSM